MSMKTLSWIAVAVFVPLVLFLGWSLVSALDTGATLPTSAANDATIGTTDWTSTANALTDDGNGAYCGCRISGAITDDTIRLNVGGAFTGDDKAISTVFSGEETRTYGGATDLWGTTPTATQINDAGFGVGISFVGNGGTSKYLLLTGYGFSIPTDATIDGIKLDLNVINTVGTALVDHGSITVYYTEFDSDEIAIRSASVEVRSGTIEIR